MIINQEEESPVESLFYDCNVNRAYGILQKVSTDTHVDSDLVFAAITEMMSILKNYENKFNRLVTSCSKEIAKDTIRKMLKQGTEND